MIASASLVAYVAYRNTIGDIKHVDVSHLLGNRPVKYSTAAQNVLVIGSDSRSGQGAKFGQGIAGQRSDTMLLVHIAPGHKGAVVMSFPRDSLIPVLGCQSDTPGDPGQVAQPGATEMLNATLANGGAPCLWKTLEAITGIFIDHFALINFTGFQNIVDAVGGVNVCLPQAINDPASGLNLPAGVHHVNGAQALSFVRERHIGQGSDLQRIQRQQFFMASLLQRVAGSDLLGNPARLLSVGAAIGKSMTTDSGLSLGTMLTLAQSLRGLSSGAVQMLTVPVVQDPNDANRVDWSQPQAGQLFSAISQDKTLPKTPKRTAHPKASASPSATPTVSPGQVRVDVLNGSGTQGLAGQAAGGLGQQGFNVVGSGDAASFNYTNSVIQYGSSADLPAANTLKGVISGAQVQQASGITAGTVNLILGSDYNGLTTSATPSPSPSSSASASVNNLTQTYGGINGNANVCGDSSAFSGPDQPIDFPVNG